VVRVIEGVRGKVALRMELCIRFGYGDVVPWVTRHDGLLTATAGPDALALFSRVHTHGENMRSVAELTVSEGQQIPSPSPGSSPMRIRHARSTPGTPSAPPSSGG